MIKILSIILLLLLLLSSCRVTEDPAEHRDMVRDYMCGVTFEEIEGLPVATEIYCRGLFNYTRAEFKGTELECEEINTAWQDDPQEMDCLTHFLVEHGPFYLDTEEDRQWLVEELRERGIVQVEIESGRLSLRGLLPFVSP